MIKNQKLQDLRNSSLLKPIDPHNSPVDPTKLISQINKLTPEVQSVLFGDKVQKVNDMRTVLGSFPNKIGPSGTPEGSMFSAPLHEQGASALKYGMYKSMTSPTTRNAINSLSNIAPQLSSTLSNMPRSFGPGASIMNSGLGNLPQQPQGYSEGGMVRRPPPPPPPSPIDPQRAKEIEASMRKAFNFAGGGMVPGTAPMPGNSPQNDTVPANLSPGEVVLPRTVTQAPNAPQQAKEFMEKQVTGHTKWAADGLQILKSHVTDEDRQFLEDHKAVLMLDPKSQNLIIAASSFKPGSKPLDDIINHLKNRIGGK